MQPDTASGAVRAQYEQLPYPACDPADERKRLVRTWLDDLPMINHYCFAGRQSFASGFRVLVAGGGTGDATIFLAEQLRGTDATIVHLDFSGASNAIARERARIRGLDNITWIEESLLRLPELGLAPFDYINCVGVLHHLPDPDAGLRALLACRKDTGALGLMVYGLYARTGVYQLQRLLRLINGTETDAARQLAAARELLGCLPERNWFRHGAAFFQDHVRGGDAGLYDLLLHPVDRAYAIDEVFEWIDGRHGLHVELTDVYRGRSTYQPELATGRHESAFLAAIAGRSTSERAAIAELLRGDVITHSFYATASAACTAAYGDPDCVPFFYHEPITGMDLAAAIREQKGRPFVMTHRQSRVALRIDPGRYGAEIAHQIDGRRSFAEIFAAARADSGLRGTTLSDAELFADFRRCHDALSMLDLLLLRHRSVELPAPVRA